MKLLNVYAKIILISLMIAIASSFCMAGISYSDRQEATLERIGNTGSAGWINRTNAQTHSITSQVVVGMAKSEQGAAEEVQSGDQIDDKERRLDKNLASDTREDSSAKISMPLVHKTGGTGDASAVKAPTANVNVAASTIIDFNAANNLLHDAAMNGSGIIRLSSGNFVELWHDAAWENFFLTIRNSAGEITSNIPLSSQQNDGYWRDATALYELGSGRFVVMSGVNPLELNGASTGTETYSMYNSDGQLEAQVSVNNYWFDDGNGTDYTEWNTIEDITYIGDGKYAMFKQTQGYSDTPESMDEFGSASILVTNDKLGGYTEESLYTNDYFGSVNGIASLGNGQFAISWYGNDNSCVRTMDSNMTTLGELVASEHTVGAQQWFTKLASVGEPYFLIVKDVYSGDISTGKESITVFDNNLDPLDNISVPLGGIADIKKLENGPTVVAITQEGADGPMLLFKTLSVDADKAVKINDLYLDFTPEQQKNFDIGGGNLVDLGGNNFGYYTPPSIDYSTGDILMQPFIAQFSTAGDSLGARDSTPAVAPTLSNSFTDLAPAVTDPYSLTQNNINNINGFNDGGFNAASNDTKANKADENIPGSGFLNGPLGSKDTTLSPNNAKFDPALIAKLADEALSRATLAAPIESASAEDMRIAMVLGSVLNNPDYQKALSDITAELQKSMDKAAEEAGAADVKPDPDAVIKAVAALSAQAIPDLLRDGDLSNIGSIYNELNSAKQAILAEYNIAYEQSAVTYYNNIVTELANNLDALQANNILSNSMIKDDLKKLNRYEIKTILDKMAKSQDKDVLSVSQRLLVYREQYSKDINRRFNEKMNLIISDFSNKISPVLKDSKVTNKNR